MKASLERAINRLWRFVAQTWNNPIVIKELRSRMRGWRAPVVLSVHLVVLSCFASLIYFVVIQSSSIYTSGSVSGGAVGQTMGQTLFYSIYMLLLALVVFLSPAFTAGTLSGERERKTIDILITTLLPARSLVLGKLTSALAYIVLLILVALPIQGLAFTFGGVILSEVAIGTLILLVTALIGGSLGITVSSVAKTSTASTVLTYALILVISLGLPIVAGILLGFLGPLLSTQRMSLAAQAALIYVGGFLLCTNPFATAVATKVLEEERNSLLFFTIQISDRNGASYALPLVSPWIVYVLFYVAVSALLIALSITIIERKRG